MKLININNLSKKYQTKDKEIHAIDNISFDINEGEIISIVGPSGCGKSTLLNILAGFESYTGSIRKNKPIKIGYMFQNDCLLPYLNVYKNASLGLLLSKKSNYEYVDTLLKKYNLYDFIDSFPSSLSGGMRQRLALIRTLAIKPNILFLDEPFSKLDEQTRKKVSEDVINIIRELKVTTILITHDINEAINLSDRIIVLSNRPCHIKNIYNKNDEDLYNKIWDNLNERWKKEIFKKNKV